MDLQQISQLTHDSLNRLTSDAYKSAFEDQTTGAAFRARINELENGPKPAASRPAGNVRADAPTPTPGMTSFDPSFDDDPNGAAAAVPPARGVRGRVEQPAAAPAAAAPAPAAQPAAPATVDESLPELVHEYQPVDRNGRAVGRPQKFKYRTKDELIQKLTAAHMASSAHIRELSRNRRLEEIASAGPTAKNVAPSTETPKTMVELAKELLEQRQANYLLSVREALNTFRLSNKEWAKYSGNPENAQSLVLAISRAGDDPADPASYTRALEHMRDLLEPAVAAEPAPTPAPAPAPVAAASAPAVSRVAYGVPTGLSNADQTSDDLFIEPVQVAGVKIVMPSGKTEVLTLAAYDRLSTDVQKRILKNGSNAAAIESLTVAEEARRMAARR